MKQLLIVTDSQYGVLKPGSIVIEEYNNDGTYTAVESTKKVSKNFAICLVRKDGIFSIPEVDINSLQKSYTNFPTGSPGDPQQVKFEATCTFPEIIPGNTYGIRVIKLGANVGERNTWTATYDVPLDSTMSKTELMNELYKQFESLTEHLLLSPSGGDGITITGTDYTKWDVQLLDSMKQGTISITQAENTVIDKAYLTNLASQCAAGKGYNYTDCGGTCLYSPEDIPDGEYCLFTLRFQVGRNAGKTRDEKVWQTVHIAVQNNTVAGTIKNILDIEGNSPNPE